MQNLKEKIFVYRAETEASLKEAMKNEIIEEVRRLVYRVPLSSHQLPEEECSAFLLWFDPLIPGLIDGYEGTGASFETFLQATIKRRLPSFYSRNIEEKTADLIACRECAPSYMYNDNPEMLCIREENRRERAETRIMAPTIGPETMSKRLLTYYLYIAPSIAGSSVEVLAKAAGLEPSYLAEMIAKVMERNALTPSASRNEDFMSRKNRCFMRMIHFDRLALTSFGAKRFRMEELAELMKTRFHRRISTMPAGALRIHYKILAEVLEIPVGTVAYNIHYIRKLFQRMTACCQSGKQLS